MSINEQTVRTAPVIIDQGADLDRLIEPLAQGGYYHAGRVCVSVQRIYVHADLQSAFLNCFAACVAALKVVIPCCPKQKSVRSSVRARPIG